MQLADFRSQQEKFFFLHVKQTSEVSTLPILPFQVSVINTARIDSRRQPFLSF